MQKDAPKYALMAARICQPKTLWIAVCSVKGWKQTQYTEFARVCTFFSFLISNVISFPSYNESGWEIMDLFSHRLSHHKCKMTSSFLSSTQCHPVSSAQFLLLQLRRQLNGDTKHWKALARQKNSFIHSGNLATFQRVLIIPFKTLGYFKQAVILIVGGVVVLFLMRS